MKYQTDDLRIKEIQELVPRSKYCASFQLPKKRRKPYSKPATRFIES